MNETPWPITVCARITLGRPLMGARGGERAQDVGHVVAVALDHVPVERAPLVAERRDAHDVLDVAVDLLAVVVDDRAQVVELVVRRRTSRPPRSAPPAARRRPSRSRRAAGACPCAPPSPTPQHTESPCPSEPAETSMPGVSWRDGMPLRVAVEGAELHQVPEREVAALGHQRVDDRRHVPDREVPEVALRPTSDRAGSRFSSWKNSAVPKSAHDSGPPEWPDWRRSAG